MREVFLQRERLDRGFDAAVAENGRELAGEGEQPLVAVPVERLLPEAVAREEEPAPHPVIDAEGEHAVEAARQLLAPGAIALQQHLGVGVAGEEPVAARLELRAQLGVIVDLAVVDNRDLALGVPHGLRPMREVDDGEAPVPEEEAGLRLQVETVSVRPPMSERSGHPLDVGPIARPGKAGEPAHQAFSERERAPSPVSKLTSARTM